MSSAGEATTADCFFCLLVCMRASARAPGEQDWSGPVTQAGPALNIYNYIDQRAKLQAGEKEAMQAGFIFLVSPGAE